MTQQGGLTWFSIKNFRGIAALQAAPDGRSVTLKGKNGVGKTNAIDGIFWGMGGTLDGEVVRNGTEAAESEIHYDHFIIRRRQARGKKPILKVTDAEGRTYPSPTALIGALIGAMERRTFSAKPEKERAEVLRRLAPGLDVSDLDAKRTELYDERTGVNRDAKNYRAQADGVKISDEVAVGEERPIVDVVDVADLAQRKADAVEKRAANERARRQVAEYQRMARDRADVLAAKRRALAELQREIAELDAADERARAQDAEAAARVAALVDPDTAAIDNEIRAAREKNQQGRAEAEAHNKTVRAQQAAAAERLRAIAERDRLAAQSIEREAESKRLTAAIDVIDEQKRARLASAKLPIDGIAIGDQGVTFDDGAHGPVAVDALNTATRIKLDVAIAAALGHRLIAVRDASLLDAAGRAEMDAFARARGVQVIAEIVSDSGDVVEAVIEEAAPATTGKVAQPALSDDF